MPPDFETAPGRQYELCWLRLGHQSIMTIEEQTLQGSTKARLDGLWFHRVTSNEYERTTWLNRSRHKLMNK